MGEVAGHYQGVVRHLDALCEQDTWTMDNCVCLCHVTGAFCAQCACEDDEEDGCRRTVAPTSPPEKPMTEHLGARDAR
jgi:hypothetical protein